jgi:hypothetical protein
MSEVPAELVRADSDISFATMQPGSVYCACVGNAQMTQPPFTFHTPQNGTGIKAKLEHAIQVDSALTRELSFII